MSSCSVQCNLIFRPQELDLGRLATAFALLKLPGMPELAHQRTLPNFTPSTVDPGTNKVIWRLSAIQIRVCKVPLSGVNTAAISAGSSGCVWNSC